MGDARLAEPVGHRLALDLAPVNELEHDLDPVGTVAVVAAAGAVVIACPVGAPTATWPWSSSGSPRPPLSLRHAGWAGATRTARMVPRSTPCASCWTASPWTASS